MTTDTMIFDTVMQDGKAIILGTPARKHVPELSPYQRIARADVALEISIYKSRYCTDYKKLAARLSQAFADDLNGSQPADL